jgi:hypothetical protein
MRLITKIIFYSCQARSLRRGSLYFQLIPPSPFNTDVPRQSIKLKNQFRSLQEDEVDFLDSIFESERVKEAAIRKETSEQLALFRKQQEEAEREALAKTASGSPVEEQESWVVHSKKRKLGRDKESLLGVKLRRKSSSTTGPLNSKSVDDHLSNHPKVIIQTGTVSQVTSDSPEIPTRAPKVSHTSSSKFPDPLGQKGNTTVQADTNKPPTSPLTVTLNLGLDGYSSEDD